MDTHDYISERDPSYSSPDLNSFDFSFAPSPNLPQTPSYNGSYQNSPCTAYSELEFEGNIVVVDDQGDYDPSEYDAPSNNHTSLLDFDMNPHVSVTPPPIVEGFERSFDHSSPASSNGLPEQESESRSRASSVSSHSHSHYPSSPPIHGLKSLRFDSPHWNTTLLPPDNPSPPSQKPPSPPSLVIPEASPSMNTENLQRAPLINAPQGDGGVMGPQLHIVPATPISGGLPPTVSFINNPVDTPTPPTWNTEAAPQNITFDTHLNSDFTNFQSNSLENYLVHQQPRSRSKSDTSTRPPTWDVSSLDLSSYHHNNRTSVNLNDVLPSATPQPQTHISFSSDAYQSTFPNPSQSGLPSHYNLVSATQTAPQYLSPEMAFIAPGLRRARSDSGRPSHRHSKSEGGISYPPSSHSDFIARAAADKQQFLHPTETVPSIGRGHHRRSSSGSRDRGIGGMGLHSAPGSSRASPYPSPNTSPLLGYDALPSIPTPQSLPVSPGMGRGRPVSMPAYGASSFGVPPGGIGELGQQLDADGNPADMVDMGPPLGNQSIRGIKSTNSVPVSKPNVTTTATAEASERRRKTDANFVCPVPGCGSTFTRHFNLKGHMRSHNEEKPFQCKWPGCGKGFARAHDCKRHEQLHFNYRPHKCEGCGKSFQRMDALNRHLRSEGGQDCQKAQDEAQVNGVINSAGLANPMGSGPSDSAGSFVAMDLNMNGDYHSGVKTEAENWMTGGVLM